MPVEDGADTGRDPPMRQQTRDRLLALRQQRQRKLAAVVSFPGVGGKPAPLPQLGPSMGTPRSGLISQPSISPVTRDADDAPDIDAGISDAAPEGPQPVGSGACAPVLVDPRAIAGEQTHAPDEAKPPAPTRPGHGARAADYDAAPAVPASAPPRRPMGRLVEASPGATAQQKAQSVVFKASRATALTAMAERASGIPMEGRDEGAVSTSVPTDAGRSGSLQALPGAGPGLIWMLERAGIGSLNDLAKADPADLARELGLVGDLIDLETWIAEARRHAQAADPVPDRHAMPEGSDRAPRP